MKEVLAAEFKGKPVSEHNLSKWRKGGYADWLLVKQMTPETRVSEVLEMSPDLIASVQGGLTDKIAVLIASRMIVELKRHSLSSDSEAEAKLWRQFSSGLASLKRFEYLARKKGLQPGCISLQVKAADCIRLHQIAPNCTKLHQIAPDCTKMSSIDLFRAKG
jgi:hypothetical protein